MYQTCIFCNGALGRNEVLENFQVGRRLMAATLVNGGISVATTLYQSLHARAVVRDGAGAPIRLTRRDIHGATLLPAQHSSGFILELPIPERVARARQPPSERKPGVYYAPPTTLLLSDMAARRALATILPWLNRQGGGKRRVRDAVTVIESAPSFDQLLQTATSLGKNKHIPDEYSAIQRLHPRMRFALEMALHGDDERRAMDGELAELEKRWRDAEEIAGIADSLLLPEGIEQRLRELKGQEKALFLPAARPWRGT